MGWNLSWLAVLVYIIGKEPMHFHYYSEAMVKEAAMRHLKLDQTGIKPADAGSRLPPCNPEQQSRFGYSTLVVLWLNCAAWQKRRSCSHSLLAAVDQLLSI